MTMVTDLSQHGDKSRGMGSVRELCVEHSDLSLRRWPSSWRAYYSSRAMLCRDLTRGESILVDACGHAALVALGSGGDDFLLDCLE